MHALDVERDVRIEALVERGAQDLQHLFSRRREVPLANDTSFGVGYAPMSALERLVLAIESRITAGIASKESGMGRGTSRSWAFDVTTRSN